MLSLTRYCSNLKTTWSNLKVILWWRFVVRQTSLCNKLKEQSAGFLKNILLSITLFVSVKEEWTERKWSLKSTTA